MPALGLGCPLGKDPCGSSLLSRPRSCSEAQLCRRPQLSLCDTGMCLLLRVSRIAFLNRAQDQLRDRLFSSIPGSRSVQIPPVHCGGLKSFMQDYRWGNCGKNLPPCHSLIHWGLYRPDFQFSALGSRSHLMIVSRPLEIQHHLSTINHHLIPTVHTNTNIHTSLHHDQQTSTYFSRQEHHSRQFQGCYVKVTSFPTEEMAILWFLVGEPKHGPG